MNLRTIVDKFKSINIKDLQNINIRDLQNIDVDQIKRFFLVRITLFVNIGLIFITVIVVFVSLIGVGKKVKILKWENGKMRERIEAVEESEKIKKEYDGFLEKLPQPIPADQLIGKLSQFAANRNVQILSFVPQPGRSDDYMDMAGVKLNLSSKNYRNLIFFAKDIENALYTMRIDKWSAIAKKNFVRQTGDALRTEETVEVNTEISSVMLKYEQ